jgi:hypothetical protein
MRKRMIAVLGLLSMVLLVTDMCNPASAATYAVGVKINDTADYTVSATGANYTTAHFYVYGIVGTTVTLNMTFYDNTSTNVGSVDITGDITIGSGSIWCFLIGRNLNATDPVFSGSVVTINETVQMSFAGASRQCNHLSASGGSINVYWDKATGIMAKINLHTMGWLNMSMTATSLWSGGLFGLSTTTLIIIAVAGVVIVAAIVLVARRGGKKR